MWTVRVFLLLFSGVSHFTKVYSTFDSTVTLVNPSDLHTLLDLELSAFLNEVSSKNANFLHSFQNIMIAVDLSTDHGKSLMRRAAEHNRHQFRNNKTRLCLNLWISVLPRGSFATSVQPVIDEIGEANLIYNGTVSTIILDCRLAAISDVTTWLEMAVREIKSFDQGKYLRIGAQFKKLDCFETPSDINYLHYTGIDVLIFATPYSLPVENRAHVLSEIASSFHCLKVVNWSTRAAIYLPLYLQIDASGQVMFEEALVDMHNFPHGPDGEWVPVIISTNMVKPEAEADSHVVTTTTGYENWLQSPTKINKMHLGIAVNTSNVPTNISNPIEIVSAVFSKILIKVSQNLSHNVMDINKCIEIRKGSETVPPLETSLLMEVTDDMDLIGNQNLIDNSLALYKAANSVSPGIVNAIIVEWRDCLKIGGYINFSDPVSTTNVLQLCQSCTQSLLVLRLLSDKERSSEDNKTMSSLQLGIAMPLQILSMIFRFYITKQYDPYPLLVMLDVADIITLQVNVNRKSILAEGAKILSRELINHLRKCRTVVAGIPRINPLQFRFYIKLTGCTGGERNLTELTEYARLFEIVSNWAVTENITVFIDTAFQLHYQSCTQEASNSSIKRCLCGWWEISQEFHSGYNSGFKVADKKSIARELYDKHNRPPTTTHHVPTEENDIHLEAIIPAAVMLIGIVVVTFGAFFYRRRSKFVLTKQEVNKFMQVLGGDLQARTTEPNTMDMLECHQAHMDKYKLSLSQLDIDTSRPLGSGQFGSVHVGCVRNNDTKVSVAIKFVKNVGMTRSHEYYLSLKALISEIKILTCLGEHKHIIGLIGACTTELRRGRLYMCLEFCQLGCLRDHLRSFKPKSAMNEYDTEAAEGSEMDQVTDQSVFLGNLYKWAKEIACGMEFIASKNIVHADLAARNVLLTSEKCAKICDFGLSRQLHQDTEYLKTEPGPLPWRWMAPESLSGHTFNEKSDIWAFGVTLWEMFSFGNEPYAGRSWDNEFLIMLEQGMRLEEPKYGGKEIYSIMKKCWNMGPSCRPTFAQVKCLIER